MQNSRIRKVFGYLHQPIRVTNQRALPEPLADHVWKGLMEVLDSLTKFWSERFPFNLYYKQHILPLFEKDRSNLLCNTTSLTSKREKDRDSKANDDGEAKNYSRYISCSYYVSEDESGFIKIAQSFSVKALDLASLTYESNFHHYEYWETVEATSILSQELFLEDLSMYI